MTVRGNVPRLMPRFERGEPTSARKMGELSDAVDRLTLGTDNLQPDALPYNWLQVVQGIITGNIDDDVLVVREYRKFPNTTEYIGTTPILVAKPWLLRRSPFDGLTRDGITYTYTDSQTRSANDGAGTILTEHVTPAYLLDDIIYFVRNVYNGTGVFFDSGSGDFSVRSVEVHSSRMWAADPPPAP